MNRRNQPRVPWVDVLGKKQESVPARIAYEDLGPYDVKLQDVYVDTGNARSFLAAERYQAIVRGPTTTDLRERVFNVVGRKYRLITPEVIVDLWDEHIGKPVTSIGALDHGERFFIATQLPSVRLPGDDGEIESTLVLVSPMNGREAIIGMLVPVRLVCMNGMITMGDIKEAFTLRHYQNNLNQLPEWLAGVYQRNVANLDKMEATWNRMAAKQITDTELRDTLDVAYPLPVAQPDMDLETRQRHQRELESAQSHREVTRNFFVGGAALGMNNEANAGTAYGLYNSIVELIDWGGPLGSGAKMATARSAAMGMAYKKKEQVLSHLAKVAA